ncbi:shikimate O-hydroxycinnamoyltransferase [Ranunculus cassubicifolius]
MRSVSTAEAIQVIPDGETIKTCTLNVEVISKENIKPSSTTPVHLQTFKLSGIDQTSPPIAVSMVLFFPVSGNNYDRDSNEKKLSVLKKSLSKTLTDFYPLSGRIDGNESIICNNQGINFFQARVGGTLDEVLNNPQADQLNQLLAVDNFSGPGPKVLLSVQANFFDRGGMAVGVSISHKAMDASSISLFLNNWAASARGSDDDIVFPKFDVRSYFTPRDDIPVSIYPAGKPPQNLVTKRFVFTSSNLSALKAKCSNDYVRPPTRVESLSALIWRSLANVARTRAESPTSTTVANIIVNIRGKMDPPLPNDVVGNMVIGTVATSTADAPQELPFLVAQLRQALRKVDGNHVKKLQTHDGFSGFINTFQRIDEPFTQGELEFIIVTSWLRFPFYEVDFGWGAPAWACAAGLHGKNLIALMDSKDGDGVEAWIALDQSDMVAFECDSELLSFTMDQS